jgi:hypothetical protein
VALVRQRRDVAGEVGGSLSLGSTGVNQPLLARVVQLLISVRSRSDAY